jgi:heterokaryon incompatibility protein (HET)
MDHIDEDAGCSGAAQKVQRWIASCFQYHPKCVPFTMPQLLDRVIAVLRDEQYPVLKVTRRGDVGKYNAPSHCWEGNVKLMLTKRSITYFTQKLPFATLPKTFQDAIKLTRNLEVEFLWIDSLCIIQDCGDDWPAQSAKMADIYEKALLCLSADAAVDADSGFLTTQEKAKAPITRREYMSHSGKKCIIAATVRYIPVKNAPYHAFYHKEVFPLAESLHREGLLKYLSSPYYDAEFYRSPKTHFIPPSMIFSRGWIFQEQLLSSRTLYCAAAELAWSCRSNNYCECWNSRCSSNPYKNLLSDGSTGGWERLVEAYSLRDYTYVTDRLVALSGIANRYF